MAKIQIKKSELDRIIKEEALKFKKAITLKKELKNIEAQLKQLNECDVNEVEAGEMHKISSDTGFEGKQAKPKFHIPAKNPNTMMEDGSEEIEDLDIDDNGEGAEEDGKIDKAAVLSAIEDLKMALNLHGEADETGEEGMEGVEGTEEEEPSEEGDEETSEEGEEGDESNSEDAEEGDETFEFEEGGMKENLDEPIEGKSVVQKAQEDDVNDNMKKDTHVKEGGDTLMESEKRRMAVLAGIMKG